MMLDVIVSNRYTLAAVILFAVGFINMLLQSDLIKRWWPLT